VLNSIIGTELTVETFIICTLASLILGVLIAVVSMYKTRSSQSFAITLAILPAVVQIDLVLKIFGGLSGMSLNFKRISRAKFMGPIFPATPVTVECSYSKESGKLQFGILSEEGKKLSSGTVELEKVSDEV